MRLGCLTLLLPVLVQPLRSQEAGHVNRLAQETSPYLLQHSRNPVDWYPWGEEALQRAKREDRVIFLSIGYSACHWCHVMERESFENPEIAKLMNEKFINIKVDREERPDLDDIYMAAVVGMTGSGGWPMSVFLTPDLQPFFGGTYYPPEDSRGMPGFRRVIAHVDTLWRDRREEVDKAAGELAEYLRRQLEAPGEPGDPSFDFVELGARMSAQRFDAEFGGFGGGSFAPKFPHASELAMLQRYSARTGDAESLAIVDKTLQAMARGGIYDQLGGGFHRYSVDRVWLVPHFEKMLYDNAQLVPVYADAHVRSGRPLYATVVRETLDYLLREMQDPAGGLYSTQDADSEGEEGKFFVWQQSEVDSVLGKDSAVASLRWDITPAGNWEHKNILRKIRTVAEVAAELGQDEAAVVAALDRARDKLFARRDQRVHPATDTKILAAWNGLAISAFAAGYKLLGDERDLDGARRIANFVLAEMRRDGRLLRTWRDGDAKLGGYLEDYAFVAVGLLDLFECDFDPKWLSAAKSLAGDIKTLFADPEGGGLFFTAIDHEQLIARNSSISESSVPAAQAMAALAFLRTALLLGDREFEDLAVGVLRANHAILSTQPVASCTFLSAIEFHLGDPREIVIVGPPDDPVVSEFLRVVRRSQPANHVVTLVHDGNRAGLAELVPYLADKQLVDGKPAVYVCRRGACQRPVTDPARLRL